MYSIRVRPVDKRHSISVTSASILARLNSNLPAHARAIERIRSLEQFGCEYSNQHFDILSHAYRLAQTVNNR